jgi:guanosine-3',5'-bis(diphosphate) 3'-pyrophosphohydrolase
MPSLKTSKPIANLSPSFIETRWLAKGAGAGLPAPQNQLWWTMAADARDMALALHEGQCRADGTEPYAWHLAEAAMIVGLFHAAGVISDEDFPTLLAIAWLHDSVEDQGADSNHLSTRFGGAVGRAVAALSKEPKSDANVDPMGDSLARCSKEGRLAALGKAADRLSNFAGEAPPHWSLSKIERYGAEGLRIRDTLAPWLPETVREALTLAASRYAQQAALRQAAPKRSM